MHKFITSVSNEVHKIGNLNILNRRFKDVVIKSLAIPLANQNINVNTEKLKYRQLNILKENSRNVHQTSTLFYYQSLKKNNLLNQITSDINNNNHLLSNLNIIHVNNMHPNSTIRTYATVKQSPIKTVESQATKDTADSVASNLDTKTEELSMKDKFKKALKEYGSIVLIFHIGISLISLQICYLLISSGIDFVPLVEYIGFSSTAFSNKIAAGASTFVVAYAVHKVFAPVRISITLGATPLIVKYLRKKGYYMKK